MIRKLFAVMIPLNYMIDRILGENQKQRKIMTDMMDVMEKEDLQYIVKYAMKKMVHIDNKEIKNESDEEFSLITSPPRSPSPSPPPSVAPAPMMTQDEKGKKVGDVQGVQVLLGPRPHCHCGLETRLHLSYTAENFEKTFFRCPQDRSKQCPFFQWTGTQPFQSLESWQFRQQPGEPPKSAYQILTEMVQRTCQTREDQREGDQCLHNQGDMLHLPEGAQEREEAHRAKGEHFDVIELDKSRLRGAPEVPSMEAEPGQTLKPIPPKLERKAKAAVRKAVSFWRSIQYLLASCDLDGQDCHSLSVPMKQVNADLVTEFTINPRGSKRTHEIAEAMGLNHEQLKVVAEIFNPACFGSLAKKYQLTAGRAFDLQLGDELLDQRKRNEVKEYLKQTKQGFVIISPPCKMYSQLLNLLKHNREDMPEMIMMKRFLKRKHEDEILFNFAIDMCNLCMDLGIHFVFEHPYSAASWKKPAMEKLMRRAGLLFTKTDQLGNAPQEANRLPDDCREDRTNPQSTMQGRPSS